MVILILRMKMVIAIPGFNCSILLKETESEKAEETGPLLGVNGEQVVLLVNSSATRCFL